MKTLKLISTLFLLTFIISCSSKNNIKDSEFQSMKKDTTVIEVDESIVSMKDPAIFGGSDFGNFFKMLRTTGNFKEMLKYTSQESLNKFGEKNVLKFYQKINFCYNIKLVSKTKENNIIYLNYKTDVYGTKKNMSMPITIENYTFRIVLINLKEQKFFLIDN